MELHKLKAVSYSRVSTEEEKQLNALAKQIQENRDVIHKMGWQFIREYIDEGKSGTQTRQREGYNRLFQDLENKDFDIVVIKDQDRLMRNPKDWYLFIDRLLKNDKKLYIHLDHTFYNPDNGLITGIKAILAEEYSRHLSRKINNAHKNRQKKGESVIITNRTWGYKNINGEIVIDETERKIIEQIFTMYANGNGSRLICKELSDRGIRNRKGNTLAENQIRSIVRNPLYMGTAVMNKTHINFDTKTKEKVPEEEWIYHENAVPPIISKELWEAANRVIDKNIDILGGITVGHKVGDSILSGKIVCGECGQSFWRNQRNWKRKDGSSSKMVYWYCSEYYRYGKREKEQDNGCNSLRLKEEEVYNILQRIGNSVVTDIDKKKIMDRVLEKITQILEDNDSVSQSESLQIEKEKLIAKKERLLDLLVDEVLSKDDYQKRIDEIMPQLDKIEESEKKMLVASELNIGIKERINVVSRVLDAENQYDIAIPIMASHVDVLKIYSDRMEIYLDFPEPLQPIMAMTDVSGGKRIFRLFRENYDIR